MGTQTTERVQFRLIAMPCCQHLFCNVNHRWPSYCPNCGQYVFDKVRSCALISDPDATRKRNHDRETQTYRSQKRTTDLRQ